MATLVVVRAQAADFELTAPDGRRVLLKDDGTWRYVDGKGREPSQDKPADKPKVVGEAVMRLERREGAGSACRFAVTLTNDLPHQIETFVPLFSVIRANGVIYDTQSATYIRLRPGDSQTREILFRGIACQDVARLQVSGGDRCVVGELDRYAPADGACLARVRVLPSELVRFEK